MHLEIIRTSHRFDAGLEGGLELSSEANALAGGSFDMLLGLLEGWAMVTAALGAAGRGFCWKLLKAGGCGRNVEKRDIALCKGAEAIEYWSTDR